MADTTELAKLLEAQRLADTGQAARAAALLEEIIGGRKAAEEAQAATPPAPPAPRDPMQIVRDLLARFIALSGNPAAMEELLTELDAVLAGPLG